MRIVGRGAIVRIVSAGSGFAFSRSLDLCGFCFSLFDLLSATCGDIRRKCHHTESNCGNYNSAFHTGFVKWVLFGLYLRIAERVSK